MSLHYEKHLKALQFAVSGNSAGGFSHGDLPLSPTGGDLKREMEKAKGNLYIAVKNKRK